MADIDPSLDYDRFCDQVEAEIKQKFPAFKTVVFDLDDESEDIATPAVLLEICEAEPDDGAQAGTGQLPALLRVEARIIMGVRTPQVKRAVRKAALALAGWLHLKRWDGVIADPARILACSPDEFDPRLDKWAVWRVEWHHRVFVGEAYDDPDLNHGGVPTAFFSFSPDIGIPSQGDYQQLPGGAANA